MSEYKFCLCTYFPFCFQDKEGRTVDLSAGIMVTSMQVSGGGGDDIDDVIDDGINDCGDDINDCADDIDDCADDIDDCADDCGGDCGDEGGISLDDCTFTLMGHSFGDGPEQKQ